ncbi:MAG: histidine kinase [Bacteroidota bacterium]
MLLSISSRRSRFLLQFCFWAIFVGGFSSLALLTPFFAKIIFRNLSVFAGLIALVAINVFYLFPRFSTTAAYSRYLGISGLLLLLVSLLSAQLDLYFFEQVPPTLSQLQEVAKTIGIQQVGILVFLPLIFFKVLIFGSGLLGSTLLEHIHLQHQTAQLATAAREEQIKTEMAFLKSQINPHFLFNNLNNIYGLALSRSEQTAEVVLQLAEMLRYMLYDCQKALVPLEREIAYIRNYFALLQLKEDDFLNIYLDIEEVDPDLLITPLLLVPLVENAYKHGAIDQPEHGWLRLNINTQEEHFHLAISNSIQSQELQHTASGGIGLSNLSRRLQLHYPGKHQFHIQKSEQVFTAKLELRLD